jgi:uncharacterized membrane protein
VLNQVAPWFALAPIIVGILRRVKLTPALRILLLYFLLAFITELSAIWMMKHKMNNLPLVHLFTLLEFLILTFFLKAQFKTNKQIKAIGLIQIIFSFYAIASSIFIQPITVFNTYSRSIEIFLLIVITLMLFMNSLKRIVVTDPESNGLIWINGALLAYFSSTLLIILLNNYLGTNHIEIYKKVWAIQAILTILMHLTISFGIWKSTTK